MLIVGMGLLMIGVALLLATVYQVKVSEPDMEDIHEGTPYAEYELRTRNEDVTNVGCIFTGFGILGIIIGILRLRSKKTAT